ncbi:hypothetical protein ACLKA6_004525 [Drosophila palustris]
MSRCSLTLPNTSRRKYASVAARWRLAAIWSRTQKKGSPIKRGSQAPLAHSLAAADMVVGNSATRRWCCHTAEAVAVAKLILDVSQNLSNARTPMLTDQPR